jgi:hypothetical protein
MYAASSGPVDDPMLPPTWKSDCAKPWRQPHQGERHTHRKRVRLRLPIGKCANNRLKERSGCLVGERDESDLTEVQIVGLLEDRIDGRQYRLHQVVKAVAHTDRGEDA